MNTDLLPLFPLETILYPSTPIFLHIFEERYKEMMMHCIEQDIPFGLVYAPCLENDDPTMRVGCSARIVQVEHLDEGRMNLVAIGRERFQIESYDNEKSYLRATTTPRPITGLEDTTSPQIQAGKAKLQEQIYQYIRLLKQLADVQFDIDQLPTDLIDLSYMGAFSLQVPLIDKQEFLQIDDGIELLQTFLDRYPLEISLLQQLLNQQDHPNDFNRHFLN